MNFKLPKITIYDRYIFKQVAMASLVAILLFSIVWIAPEIGWGVWVQNCNPSFDL